MFLNSSSQFIGMSNCSGCFKCSASSSYDDRSVPQYAPNESLIHTDALDLWEQDFDASTREQTHFNEYAPVRNGHFGRKPADYASRDQGDGPLRIS